MKDKEKTTDVGNGIFVSLNWSVVKILFLSWGAVLLGMLLFRMSALRVMLPLIMVVLIGYLVFGTVIALLRESPVADEEEEDLTNDWDISEPTEPVVTKIPEE